MYKRQGFNLLNHSNKTIKIRLEYGIYYQKANGTLTKKVHKISEKEYTGNSTTRITRKHSFRVVTKMCIRDRAYDVLSNPEKRSRYDQFGHAGVSGAAGNGGPFGGFGGEGMSMDDIFSMFGDIFGGRGGGFGGGFGGFSGFGGGGSQQRLSLIHI